MSHSDLVHDLVGVVVGLAVDEWPMHGSMADRAAGAAALAVGETAILAAPPLAFSRCSNAACKDVGPEGASAK